MQRDQELQDAVSILLSDQPPAYPLEREFAFATFSGWLNSPDEQIAPDAMRLATLLHAAIDTKKRSELPNPLWVEKGIDAERLLAMMNDVISHPFRWQIDETEIYNHNTYASDIVRFIISFKNKRLDPNKRASLGKAFAFINQHGGFRRGNFDHAGNSWRGETGHQAVWKVHKRSACFQFVRYHDTDVKWAIDPRLPEFLTVLKAQANRVGDLRSYFAKVLWVQNLFREKIDKRSMSEADFFPFPDDLKPERCKVPRMPGSAYDKLASYSRNAYRRVDSAPKNSQ